MKRLLWITAAVLVLLTLGTGLFFAHRQRQSYAVQVPRGAVSVVKVQVDGLVADVLWSQLWSPSPIKRDAERGGTYRFLRSDIGLAIPANLFLYRFADRPHVLFGVLRINDVGELQAFIRQQDWAYEAATPFSRVVSQHLVALHSADSIAFALCWEPGEQLASVAEHLRGLLQGDQQEPLAASRFSELKNRKGHLNIMGQHALRLDFKRGEIAFSTNGAGDAAEFPSQLKTGNTGFLQLPAWCWSLMPPAWQSGGHTVSRDSLMRYISGKTCVQWRGATTQQDTVINYAYDDDFNPVEVREAVDRSVPALFGAISSDTKHLAAYLAAQGILDADLARIKPEVFPLFSLYTYADADKRLFFSTVQDAEKQLAAVGKGSGGGDFLYGYFDIVSATQQGVLPGRLEALLAPLSTIEIQGIRKADAEMVVHGRMTLPDESVNSLVQLIHSGALNWLP
ncbi:hypothetical protein SAMN05421747_10273 [Parapedobacter composti]|uniref:Uncharacterized protein n=1 Tax=Parapedobacter composti TaxID=623281 RepID=A0A1I1F2S7_9SPHI|nr:hypothetical protein [Parapedobacter composti]SFB91463.1 hypothetical protein SAMN05421747_10273 [Parapedobacter composti]